MQINTDKVRSTYVKGKKAYFVSDIASEFGERPVNQLVKNKTIFMERVRVGNNSQMRRLVFQKDLQQVPTEQCSVKAQEVRKELPVLTVAAVRKLSLSVQEEKNKMLKEEIKALCKRYTDQEIRLKGITREEAEENDRWQYRESYRTLYSTFDRYMRAELKKTDKSLEDLGLGYAKKTGDKPYLDRIADAGQLESLHVIAQALFGQLGK